jgi:hypothetical protein
MKIGFRRPFVKRDFWRKAFDNPSQLTVKLDQIRCRGEV